MTHVTRAAVQHLCLFILPYKFFGASFDLDEVPTIDGTIANVRKKWKVRFELGGLRYVAVIFNFI